MSRSGGREYGLEGCGVFLYQGQDKAVYWVLQTRAGEVVHITEYLTLIS